MLLRCTGDDRGAGERRCVSCRGKTRVAPSEFFVDQDFLKRTQTGAAVCFGNVEVQQTHLVSGLNRFLGVVCILVPVFRVRSHLIAGKLVGEFFQHGLHFVKLEVHHEQAKHRSLKSD